MELLNSQLRMHFTLWILKKATSKMHALGQSVTIVYGCGCVLAVHLSIMYTLQICLIRTNLKALPSYRKLIIRGNFSGGNFLGGGGIFWEAIFTEPFLSLLHHFEHFSLKSPMRIEQTGWLFFILISRRFSSEQKFSNSSWLWLGDL